MFGANAIPANAGVIQSTLMTTDVLCFGDSNGTASISATGGSLPYAYSWTTGDTTQSISGLAAGTYNYHVSDTNGCVFQTNFTIDEPTALTITNTISDYNGYGISSEGANDGSIDITVGGGTTPYTQLEQQRYDRGSKRFERGHLHHYGD